VEGIVAGADAHGMVPRDGKGPEDEGAENRLTEDERKDVALAREKPAHGRAAYQRKRNEDRIRPMERGEEYTGDKGRAVGVGKGPKQAVHGQRLQAHLLQKTECKITEETARLDEMSRQTVQRAESDARKNDCGDEDEKNRSCEFRGGFEIVRAPTERFGRVTMENEAREKPNREDEPSVKAGVLPAPDVEEDDDGEGDGFEEIAERRDERRRRFHGNEMRDGDSGIVYSRK
jgi:hypothetical protein